MQLKLLILKKILLNPMGQGGHYGLMDSDIQQMFAYSAFYLNHTHEVLMVYAAREIFFIKLYRILSLNLVSQFYGFYPLI